MGLGSVLIKFGSTTLVQSSHVQKTQFFFFASWPLHCMIYSLGLAFLLPLAAISQWNFACHLKFEVFKIKRYEYIGKSQSD